jgi:hypothetical protein
MKTYCYDEPIFDNEGNIIDNIVMEITEDRIITMYWPQWAHKMYKKYGSNIELKPEDCISDWVIINYAWEKKE